MLRQFFISAFMVMFIPANVLAGGFQINMLGMRATSLAGASTGFSGDASSSFHNPGAMTFREYSQIAAGIGFSTASTSYLSPSTSNSDMESKLYTPLHLYGVYKLNEKMAVGLSINTPFHQRSKWSNDWSGRYIVKENNIKAVYYQPTFSYAISEKLGIGGGAVIALGSNLITKDYPIASSAGDVGMKLDGKSTGFGFNIGLFFKPNEDFSAGLNYRSSVKMDVSNGDATFYNVPSTLVNEYPASTGFETSYVLPSVITIGAAANLTRELMICLDVNYTTWKSFDSLAIEFNDYENLNYSIGYFYKNSFSIRLGAQYSITDKIDARAGVAFDKSPVEDQYVSPINPDSDRFMFSLGGTVRIGEKFGIDVAYMLQNLKERESVNVETNFGGSYKSLVNIFGFTLSYQFGTNQ